MYDVLLTGAETRQCVVTIRSLGGRGVKILAVGERRNSVGFYSKYISGRARLPSPESDKEAFVDRLLELVKKYRVPYVYPVTEGSLIPLDERRSEVESLAGLIASSSETIRLAVDKKLTLEIAEQQGVPATRTLYPDSIEEAEQWAEESGYPVILKPRGRSHDSRVAGSFDFKVLYAHNREELSENLAGCHDGVFPMMQEYAYGPHTQFVCFMENGEAHSHFQDDGVRLLPLTGGVGTKLRSRKVIPVLAERSIRIFKAMKWDGCAQAQFKGPGKDGDYRFIEVSVRLPASVGSSVFSGIDLPWMQYQLFIGNPVDQAASYKIGKSTRWFRGDTLAVAHYLLGDIPKSGDQLPSRPRVFLSWAADFVRPGLRNYVESFSDPLPGFVESVQLIRDMVLLMIQTAVRWFPFLRRMRRLFTS